jgi:hypothetical protein
MTFTAIHLLQRKRKGRCSNPDLPMHIKGMSIPMTMITLMIKRITLMTIMTTGTATRFLTGTTMTTPKTLMKSMIGISMPTGMNTGGAEDRAFAHLHEHGHDFFHAHHHTHHPEHAGVVHKIFGDPLRDWFGAFLMVLLIGAGYFKWLPGYLSDGMLVCAAVIGIFPLLKNALFDVLYKRRFRFELPAGIFLLAGLLMGRFLEVSLIALLLLIGSFMRLNFSWKE